MLLAGYRFGIVDCTGREREDYFQPGKSLARILGWSFDLSNIGGSHSGPYGLVLLEIWLQRSPDAELVEGSRMVRKATQLSYQKKPRLCQESWYSCWLVAVEGGSLEDRVDDAGKRSLARGFYSFKTGKTPFSSLVVGRCTFDADPCRRKR